MGFFDYTGAGWLKDATKGLFQNKEIPQDLDTRNPDAKRVQGTLADWITKYLPSYQPGEAYSGKRTAPMSGFENAGMGLLFQYLANPSGELLGPAAEEVKKTLTNQYDPSTSPFYKSMRDTAMLERKDATDRLNREVGARGKYFSSERVRGQGDIEQRTGNFMQQVLAQMTEAERERKLQAVPQAKSITEAQDAVPLRKITAATSFGSLPRQIEDTDYERLYQDFVRQRQEKQGIVSAAGSFPAGSPLSFRAYDQSPFEKYLMPLLQGAAKGAMMAAI